MLLFTYIFGHLWIWQILEWFALSLNAHRKC